jgi:hypothetical protein
MPILVIGGNSRKVGKTSVVAGLIAALPAFHWTALKITEHRHNAACDAATADQSWAISEEEDRSGKSDTSRFLVAGAKHSWWIRTDPGCLEEAMPRIREIVASAQYAIIESNSILRFLKPDLYLTVLDPQAPDFKASAQTYLDQADAVLLHSEAESKNPVWKQVSLKPVKGPIFAIQPPNYATPEVVEFVHARLGPSPVTSQHKTPLSP